MATLGIQLQNGDMVEAPLEEWFAALMAYLDDAARARIAAKITENRMRGASWISAGRAIARPTRGYVLEAEPGVIGLSRR